MDFILRYEIYSFFKHISDSFSPTPLELTLIILGLALFSGMFIFVYSRQKKKVRETSLQYSAAAIKKVVKKLSLSPGEANLLDRIAAAHPANLHRKQIVVQRASAFDEASGILIEDEEANETEVKSLRDALAEDIFQEDHGIATTRDLSKGLHLYITLEPKYSLHGNIKLKTPEMMRIELRDNELGPLEGERITAYFRRNNDTFYFKAEVLESTPGKLKLSHPEKIKKVQRRRYYRKECKKTAIISSLSGKNRVPTTITDLGGGGATAKNRDGRFSAGEGVFLSFKLPPHDELRLQGRIVRTTEGKEKLHIRFEKVTEQDRDKIISYLFKT
jgi:hypothetical protein